MKRITRYKIVLFFILLSYLGNYTASGQKTFNNSVKVHTGGFYIKDRYQSNKLTSLIGISYDRKLINNFWIGANYSQWKFWFPGIDSAIHERIKLWDTAYGTLEERAGYKMFDITASYRKNLYRQRHFVSGGVGLSYCWGWNRYVETRAYPAPPGYDSYGTSYAEKVSYFGIVPKVSYDMYILKERCNIGIDLRARYYVGYPQHQYDYGFHAGVNF